MNQWWHLNVKKPGTETAGGWGRKKGGVWCLRRRWGRAEARGVEREWSKAARHHVFLFFFFFFPSLTHHTIRHCLFSDWEMQGHQKAAKRISEPLEAQTHTEGMSATPKYMLQFTTRGWKEENLDRVDLKKKNKIKPKLHRRQCVMLYARLLCK